MTSIVVLIWFNFTFIQMSNNESDSSSDGEQFFEIISKRAKLAGTYTDLYLCNQPTRTSI
jgi:hypothetical protein